MENFKKLVSKSTDLTEIISGGSVALFFKLASVALNYLFLYFIAHFFGAKGVGLFSTSWTILMIGAVVGKLGFDTSIVKFIAESIANQQYSFVRKIYKNGLFIVLLSSTVVGIILFFGAPYLNQLFFENTNTIYLIQIIAFSIIPFSLMGYNAESMKGMKNITAFSLFQNGTIYLLSLGILWLLMMRYSNLGLTISALSLALFVLMLISFMVVLLKLPKKTPAISGFKTTAYKPKSMLQISIPMLLSNSLFLIMNWTDILMLSAFCPEQEVGIYNTALKIAALNSLVLFAVNSIGMPKFAELYGAGKKAAFKQTVKQSSLLISMVSLPVLLIILLFPRFLLSIFGQEFTAGTFTLIILAVGQFINAFSGSTIPILNMTGKEKTGRNILLAGTIVNIALNYFLIPLKGIDGAAIATATSTVLWNTLAVFYIYKYHRFLTYPI